MIITRINLLPWREELRQEQKKQFLMMAVMSCVLAAAIVGLIHFQMQAKIDYQLSRNRFLTKRTSKSTSKPYRAHGSNPGFAG
jgi:type IV pilus assembly protein PilN